MISIYSAMEVALTFKAISVTDPVVQKMVSDIVKIHTTMTIDTSIRSYTEEEHGMLNRIDELYNLILMITSCFTDD